MTPTTYLHRSTGRYAITVERTAAGRLFVLRRFPNGTWTAVAAVRTVEEGVAIADREMPASRVHPFSYRLEPARRADGLIVERIS